MEKGREKPAAGSSLPVSLVQKLKDTKRYERL